MSVCVCVYLCHWLRVVLYLYELGVTCNEVGSSLFLPSFFQIYCSYQLSIYSTTSTPSIPMCVFPRISRPPSPPSLACQVWVAPLVGEGAASESARSVLGLTRRQASILQKLVCLPGVSKTMGKRVVKGDKEPREWFYSST